MINGNLTVNRILALDPQTQQIIAEASFDSQGNAYFTTPEPSTLALLGTELFGIAPFARRERH